MKPLSRRSVIAGSAAVVTAIPAVGLAVSVKSSARARVEYHVERLERAMREHYGTDLEAWVSLEQIGDCRPVVWFIAKT